MMPCFSQHIFIESFDGNVCKSHIPLVIVLRTTIPFSLQDDTNNHIGDYDKFINFCNTIIYKKHQFELYPSSWIKMVYSDKLS